MTTFRIPRQRGPEPERGTRLCPVCWQLAGDPCRALISTSGKGKIRLGKLLTKMHDARRGDSTGDPGKLPPKPKAPERPRKDGLGFTYPKHGRSVEHPS